MRSNQQTTGLGWLISFVLGLVVSSCCNTSRAACISHIVQPKETLKMISKEYYDNTKYWLDIYYQNELKTKKLKVGQELYLFIPDNKDEWYTACASIVLQRLADKKRFHKSEFAQVIPAGILLADELLEYPSAMEKLEMCRWALATVEHESMYGEFFVGAVGEISSYQFRLETARLTLRKYSLNWEDDSDKTLVKFLLSDQNATFLFILHFNKLYKKYNGLQLAWKRYNGYGEHAERYADRIMERYREIKKLQPMKCGE